MIRARMRVGVELLLAHPEKLGDDGLEGDLYLLRDRLTATTGRRALHDREG
jgi:hypothetical protein